MSKRLVVVDTTTNINIGVLRYMVEEVTRSYDGDHTLFKVELQTPGLPRLMSCIRVNKYELDVGPQEYIYQLTKARLFAEIQAYAFKEV